MARAAFFFRTVSAALLGAACGTTTETAPTAAATDADVDVVEQPAREDAPANDDVARSRRYAAAMVRAAEQKLKAGDFLGAMPLLDEALSRDAENGRAWLLSAQATEGAGAPAEDVAARWARALALLPDDAEAWRLGALFAEGRGDLATARQRYEKAIALRPDDAVALVRLAALELSAGDAAGAVRRYEAVLNLDPTSVQATLGLAEAAEKAGDPKTAEAALLDLVKRWPDVALYRSRLVAFYERTGRPEDAARAQAALEKRDPKDKRKLRELKPSRRR